MDYLTSVSPALFYSILIPLDTELHPTVGSLLGQRHRRWPFDEPTVGPREGVLGIGLRGAASMCAPRGGWRDPLYDRLFIYGFVFLSGNGMQMAR